MVIDQIKVSGKASCNFVFCSFMLVETFRHPANLCFNCLMFAAFLSVIVKHMEIPFFFIRWIKLPFYCNSAYSVIPDAISAVFFKSTLHFKDKTFHKFFHSLHHNDKVIAAFVHVMYIFFAEISPVQDKSNIFIAITTGLFQCIL